jgi:hypothetical protein
MAAAAAPIEAQPKTQSLQAQLQQKPPTERRAHLRRIQLGWGVVVVLLTLFGGIAGAYSLRPQIGVTASPSLNKGAPYEPILTISNNGLAELYDLKFSCTVSTEIFAHTSGQREGRAWDDRSSDVGNNVGDEAVLRPQTSIVRTCAARMEISDVDIIWVATALHIHYRLGFWPTALSKIVRFKSRTDPSGQVQWFPDPNADPKELLP